EAQGRASAAGSRDAPGTGRMPRQGSTAARSTPGRHGRAATSAFAAAKTGGYTGAHGSAIARDSRQRVPPGALEERRRLDARDPRRARRRRLGLAAVDRRDRDRRAVLGLSRRGPRTGAAERQRPAPVLRRRRDARTAAALPAPALLRRARAEGGTGRR